MNNNNIMYISDSTANCVLSPNPYICTASTNGWIRYSVVTPEYIRMAKKIMTKKMVEWYYSYQKRQCPSPRKYKSQARMSKNWRKLYE